MRLAILSLFAAAAGVLAAVLLPSPAGSVAATPSLILSPQLDQ